MSATRVRCLCGRCAGGITYARLTDYLEAHQLTSEEYVLDSEVALEVELDDAIDRHPSARTERYVGTFRDGSQILLEIHASSKMTAATRSDRYAVWGPPTMLDEAP